MGFMLLVGLFAVKNGSGKETSKIVMMVYQDNMNNQMEHLENNS